MFKLIKAITINCPACGATITFPLSENDRTLSELYAKINSLKCPNCSEDLSSNAEVVRDIQSYNRAVLTLSDSMDSSNVTINF